MVCYLNDDEEVSFSEDGELKKARLHFLRTEISREDAFVAEINELMNDKEFISKHSLYISNNAKKEKVINQLSQPSWLGGFYTYWRNGSKVCGSNGLG